jgi:two-component system, cell cycle sensor histidine kinase and response regulator CckA
MVTQMPNAKTRETVLIVEDDEGIAALEQMQLERAGYAVTCAGTADEAFDRLHNQVVHLVLLDYRLPGDVDGLDFHSRMKEAGFDIPVILVTGYSNEALAIRALRAGIRDFVTKSPEYLDYLPEAVDRVLKQVRTENRLAETDARLTSIIDSAKDAIIVTDADHSIRLLNRSAEAMFRCPAAKALGQAAERFIAREHPADPEAREDDPNGPSSTMTELIRYGNRGLRADGTEFPVEASLSRASVGGRRFYTLVVRDITERMQAERYLLAQHAVTRILAASPSLDVASMDILRSLCEGMGCDLGQLWRVDHEAGVIRCVLAWHRPLDGIAELEALSKQFSFAPGVGLSGRVWASREVAWIADIRQDANLPRADAALKAGLHGAVAFPITFGADVLGVLSFFSKSLEKPQNDLIKMMTAIGSQIGQFIERKRAEDESLQSEERFRQLAENIREVFWLHDPIAHKILYVSPAYETVWGATRQSLYASPESWMQGIHPDDRDAVRTSFSASFVDGVYDAKYRIVRNDRSLRWIHDRGFPVRNELGKVYRIAGVAEDITERVRAAETREKLEAQLVQSQKMEAFGQLAGGIAHDFNNLLTIISGYSDVLLSLLPADDPNRESVKYISEAGSRAASLTRQLLAFSRKTVLEPKVLDLNEAVRETEKMLRRLIGEDIVVTAVLDPALRKVKVDPGLFGQVLMNLAVNARDAMKQGGKLTIETGNVKLDAGPGPGDYVLVTVSDTGCGMPADVKARIFEPFFTTKAVGHGTGLGLAVVHGIVSQSGGHIEVVSEPSRGTAFRIFLPAVAERLVVREGPEFGKESRGHETVLLVEDEDNVRGLFSLVLRSFGYKIVVARDGREAIQIAEKHVGDIDLLLTDVVMPHLSGRQVAETLQPRFPKMKVLYMTGFTDDAVIRHGLVQGEVPLLQKPATPAQLAAKVRSVLDGAK